MITHSSPYVKSKDIIREIKKVLDSKMLAQGEVVRKFEEEITSYLSGYKTACVGSGTAAIWLALKVLEVKEGEEVVLPTLVCKSVLEAVMASQAIPVLCDVDDDWVVSYQTIKPFLTKKTKVIIVPHIYGIKADINNIRQLGLPVIEDCAQAFGKTIDNRRIGIEGELSIFSFHPTKCLTTGEGGAVMVNYRSKKLTSRLLQMRNGGPRFCRINFAPMSDITAAIGLTQLSRYDYFLQRRFQIARYYDYVLKQKEDIEQLGGKPLPSMFFRYVVKTKRSFNYYVGPFAKEGIIVRKGVDLLLHRLLKMDRILFRNAEYLFEHTLSIPIYPVLSDSQIKHIGKAMAKIIK